ncbi:hypothetical protein PU661_20135 [Bacillus cereus]|nr:hypothetical protein [Bacillus cereus]
MNKKHWNTMYIHKDVEQVQINKMIDWSYDLVLQSFFKEKAARVIILICIRGGCVERHG